MNDSSTIITMLIVVNNGLLGVVIYFLKRLVNRVDEIEKDVQLQKTNSAVTDTRLKSLEKIYT